MRLADLARYAGMIVRGCVGLECGDVLLVMANLAQRELAVAVVEEAYRAGAAAVDVVYEDARVEAARVRYAQDVGGRASWELARGRALGDERVTFVRVLGEFEQQVVGGLPAERVAESARRSPLTLYLGRGGWESRLRGTICCWPTPEWASRVFPALAVEKAQRKLARDLLSFCRLAAADPPGGRRIWRRCGGGRRG
jgi:aminopeptidase